MARKAGATKADRNTAGKAANKSIGKDVYLDRYRLSGTYERLRRTLLELPDSSLLDKALSYWVLPSDRRLPIAFLDQPLHKLLDQPLDELMATPGVGQKKILGFFDLLRRAAKSSSSAEPFGLYPLLKTGDDPEDSQADAGRDGSHSLDYGAVSESLWSNWCETVRRSGLGQQKLGSLAPSLQRLPTVIWHTPLAEYGEMSLAEIRGLKTHGEKRVRAILEVFGTVHEALSTAVLNENIDLSLAPRFVRPLSQWMIAALETDMLPTLSQVQQFVVQPLVKQIEIDLGPQIGQLAAGRLRLDDDAPNVKSQADSLGVTRTRVYQLLEDCGKVMAVRWAEGRWLLSPLLDRYRSNQDDHNPQTLGLLYGVRDLFFPEDASILTEK